MTRRFFRLKGFHQTGLAYPGARGPFLETPGNLSGLKSSIHSEIKRISNKKTPEGVYAGCVGVRKNYRYGEWQWKIE